MTIRWTRTIPGPPGGPEIYVDLISNSRPDRLDFQWRLGPTSAAPMLKLRRTIDGRPCELLRHPLTVVEPDPDRQIDQPVDTATELDEIGEMVRAHLDSVPFEELLQLCRAVADQELTWRRDEQRDLQDELPRVKRAERTAHLWKVALHLDDPCARAATIAMLPTWTGSAVDLSRAARAVAAPAGTGGAA